MEHGFTPREEIDTSGCQNLGSLVPERSQGKDQVDPWPTSFAFSKHSVNDLTLVYFIICSYEGKGKGREGGIGKVAWLARVGVCMVGSPFHWRGGKGGEPLVGGCLFSSHRACLFLLFCVFHFLSRSLTHGYHHLFAVYYASSSSSSLLLLLLHFHPFLPLSSRVSRPLFSF